MKGLLNICLLLILVLSLPFCSCKKSNNGGGGGTPEEENLMVVTSPAADGHTEAPAPGPNFPLTVTITSKMPPQGVRIEVKAAAESNGTVFYSPTSVTTTNPNSNFTITNTPVNIPSLVTITVTSVSKPSNKFTGTYKYSRKS